MPGEGGRVCLALLIFFLFLKKQLNEHFLINSKFELLHALLTFIVSLKKLDVCSDFTTAQENADR